MSAEIYQFPPRGRFAADKRRDDSQSQKFSAQRVAETVYGSGWYHDEAIEAERNDKQK